jgi:phospholipase/carboxylesterase
MADLLPTVEINPPVPVVATVVWMHGLGADGYDFVDMVPALGLRERGVRFVFPHAPLRAVTINNGYVMRAWYDVRSLSFVDREDRTGLEESRRAVEALVHREKEWGVAPGRVVLAGFSQGGALALYTALRSEERLAGVVALSTYLPVANDAETTLARIPVLMAHGTGDAVIPLHLARLSRQALEGRGYVVEWHEYFMGHELCPEEVADVRVFLEQILGLGN